MAVKSSLKMTGVKTLVASATPTKEGFSPNDVKEKAGVVIDMEKVGKAETRASTPENPAHYLFMDGKTAAGKSVRFFSNLLQALVLKDEDIAALHELEIMPNKDGALVYDRSNDEIREILDRAAGTLYDLVVTEEQDGEKSIDLGKAKSIKFVGAASFGKRKDSENNEIEDFGMHPLRNYEGYAEYRKSLNDGETPSFTGLTEFSGNTPELLSVITDRNNETNARFWNTTFIVGQ